MVAMGAVRRSCLERRMKEEIFRWKLLIISDENERSLVSEIGESDIYVYGRRKIEKKSRNSC